MAERIGALDILSNGRVEFGTGRSSGYEQAGFEVPIEESRAMWQEALRIIPRMWASDEFSYAGRYWNIPERNIIPKPIQRPDEAIANGGAAAAVDYLTDAFRVFAGGLRPDQTPPSEETRDERDVRMQGAAPYLDLVKAYPLIPKMMRGEISFEELDREDMVIVGDVDRCIRKLEHYAGVGVDRVLCLMQAGNLSHEAVMRSIDLFGKHVIPHFDRS